MSGRRVLEGPRGDPDGRWGGGGERVYWRTRGRDFIRSVLHDVGKERANSSESC
jgi:hypothetical protein